MKILDPIPVGYMRLTEMWGRLATCLWGTTSPTIKIQSILTAAELPKEIFVTHQNRLEDVTNAAFKLAVSPFLAGILEARVKFPEETGLSRIPSVEWDSFFPERMFLSDVVEPGINGYWEGLAGRTPIVSMVDVDKWLADLSRGRLDRNQPRLPVDVHLREEILALVLHGLIEPNQGDQLAAEWGVRPQWVPSADQAVGGLIEFDQKANWWKLFDAALWVGCEGEELGTDQIARGALDDRGADRLFKALNRHPWLRATGVTRNLIREDIPANYWEFATTDPDKTGHYVSFIDDAAEDYWGTLTPVGGHDPRWNRIEVETKALKRVFVFGKAKPASCRKWLEEIMADSPEMRPRRKKDYLEECKKRFKISEAGFERAWREALQNIPEARPNWTKGGRPKNPK